MGSKTESLNVLGGGLVGKLKKPGQAKKKLPRGKKKKVRDRARLTAAGEPWVEPQKFTCADREETGDDKDQWGGCQRPNKQP